MLHSTKEIVVGTAIEAASTQSEYDRVGHLKTITYPDGEHVGYTYDAAGRISGVHSGSNGAIYLKNQTYDRFGRVRETLHGNGPGGDGVVEVREYHGADRRFRLAGITAAGPSGATGAPTCGNGSYLDWQYTDYKPTGHIQNIQDASANCGLLNGTGIFAYDVLGRLKSVTGNPLATSYYDYDKLGNVKQVRNRTFAYHHDRPHTVATVTESGVQSTIEHDENGNRKSKPGQWYEFDAENRLTHINDNGVNAGALMTYDFNGRQVLKTSQGVSRRYFSEIAEYRVQQGVPILAKYYFAGGRRIAMREVSWTPDDPSAGIFDQQWFASVDLENGAKVVFGAALLALVLLPDRSRRRRGAGITVGAGQVKLVLLAFVLTHSMGGDLLRQCGLGVGIATAGGGGGGPPPTPSLTLQYMHFHADHLGSPVVLTGSTGNLLEHIRYWPYGEERGHWDASLNVVSDGRQGRTFTDYEEDDYSELQYAGARHYDPKLGMFLTHDPAREFPNPYLYTGGDPINLADPSGMCVWDACLLEAAIIGAVAGALAGGIQAAVNGASVGEAFKAAAIGGAIGGISAPIGSYVLGQVVTPVLAAKLASATGIMTAETARSVITGTLLTASLGQASYGISQGDYSGIIGLGVSVGLGFAFVQSGASNRAPRPLTNEEQGYLEALHGREFGGVNLGEGFVGERWAAGQVRSDAEINVEAGFSQYPEADRLGLLGHEGTHIVQRQQGILNNFKGFLSHARASITGADLYAIPDDYSGSFGNLNFEQQAVIVENVGRLQLGQHPLLFPYGRNVRVPRTLGLYLEYRGVIAR